jgi:hypothetical protein
VVHTGAPGAPGVLIMAAPAPPAEAGAQVPKTTKEQTLSVARALLRRSAPEKDGERRAGVRILHVHSALGELLVGLCNLGTLGTYIGDALVLRAVKKRKQR